jgi:carboxypeptidase PM20D1
MIFRILLAIVAILVVSTIVLAVRTMLYRRRHPPRQPIAGIPVAAASIAEHLAAAVRCQTVPLDAIGTPDPAAFARFHSLLEQLYPRVHAALKREVVSGYSLLYTWTGTKPDLGPVQLMAHQDVVPAEEETLDRWTHPPFDGVIADGLVWGRGSLDIKNQLIGILEAAETLLARGFQPERTIQFAFGHDEETGGNRGAAAVGQLLQDRGVRLAGIVDEGGGIIEGMVPDVKGPVALIGTGEKGYLTLEFTVQCPPGHSSAPPEHTAIGILAHALARLEDQPLPPHVRTARPMYWALGPAVPLWLQVCFANEWLLGWLLQRRLDASPEARAYVRTTAAITVFHSGDEDNTLPAEARALVNYRLLPHDSIAMACEHVRRVINDDRVQFKPVEGKANEAVGPSPVKCPAYLGLSRAIREIYGDVPEAPFVMLGGTDCGHYVEVCDNIYRFTPLVMDPSFAGREHGVDECIPVAALGISVQFYARLMQIWGTEQMS